MPSSLVKGRTVEIPEPVINWLFNVIQPIYQDPRRTFHDSVELLSEFKQLRPRTRVYTSSSGTSELLLCIHGKLEIGSPLPVLIWIPVSYPIEHPLLFIDLESASNSMICNGPYVTAEGEIQLPMLDHWHPEISNLSRLIEELISINFENGLLSRDVRTGSQALPDLPPKPPVPPVPPRPAEYNNEGPSSILSKPVRSPGLPPRIHSHTDPPRIPERPPATFSADLLDAEISVNENNRHANALEHLQQTIEEIRSSSCLAAEEQLETRKTAIKSAIKQFEMTLDYEKTTLQRSFEAIQQTKALLVREIDAIKRRTEQIAAYETERGESPDPSTIIATENTTVGQLYRLAARDYALSDAVNTLSRLLNNDIVKLDIFVKKTRALAREQFLIRLQMQKIIAKLEQQ